MSYALVARAIDGARVLVAEQLEYRELLVQMTRRDLLLRYKQTIMGFGWAVFMPLVNTIVFSLVFTRVAPIDVGMPYPLFVYIGLVAWTFFASSLRFAILSLTGNANLVSKVYFPREIFPFSAVLVTLVDSALAALILVGMLIWFHVAPGRGMLMLPALVACQIALTAGASLALAMANLYFRDVKYVFEILLNVGMFATSVAYPVGRIGGRIGWLLSFNPLSTLIDGYRAALTGSPWPAPSAIAFAAVASVSALAFGWTIFHRGELRFAEHV